MTAWGGFVGWLLGCGMASVVAYDGPWRAIRFHRLVYDAVHGVAPRERVVRRSMGFLGTTRIRTIELRQLRAGEQPDAVAHVLHSLTAALAGLALGSVVVALLAATAQLRNPFGVIVLLGVAMVSGWLVADYRLGSRTRERQRAAMVALPAFVESLALAVAAGAALPQALSIVAGNAHSVLAPTLRDVLSRVGRGVSMEAALQAFAEAFPTPQVQRLVNAVLIALERGTPIADVLHAQAVDARAESRRLLLEHAGRREVSMLVPVIFLVLPAVVIVALYPGLQELTSLAT